MGGRGRHWSRQSRPWWLVLLCLAGSFHHQVRAPGLTPLQTHGSVPQVDAATSEETISFTHEDREGGDLYDCRAVLAYQPGAGPSRYLDYKIFQQCLTFENLICSTCDYQVFQLQEMEPGWVRVHGHDDHRRRHHHHHGGGNIQPEGPPGQEPGSQRELQTAD